MTTTQSAPVVDLIERLRAKRRSRMQGRMPDDDVRYELVNPDGPEAAATLAAQAAEIERLMGLLAEEREENLWNAYNTGHETGDGQWTHMFMSDGEWLVRECGLDPRIGHYDAATIKAAIPIAARTALGGPQ
jgi:hypothetical protein